MTNPTHWTPEQVSTLRKLYPDLTAETVAREIGRSLRSVHQKAAALGIGKSDAFKQSFLSGRIRAAHIDPRMTATRFQPGLTPWNKGVKGSVGLHPNCRPTQFKPGNKPQQQLPIGSYRISTSKGLPRLEQKTSETPGSPHLRWTPVSRMVWERHHGPVPKGHIVIFKEAKLATTDLQSITVDKLICISRAENARRNHAYTRYPEVARLIQLKGAIARQVNRIAREQTQKENTP